MIRKYGYIPTAKPYVFVEPFTTPFFSHMVRLLAGKRGKQVLREYLPHIWYWNIDSG